MPKAATPPTEIPQIVAALAAIEQAALARPTLPGYTWETAQQAANTMLSWQALPAVAVAALLAPLLEHGLVNAAQLAERYDREAVALAGRLLAWRTASAAG